MCINGSLISNVKLPANSMVVGGTGNMKNLYVATECLIRLTYLN